MGGDQVTGFIHELMNGAAVEIENLDEAPLGIFNGGIDLVGRDVHETRGLIGKDRLETQTVIAIRLLLPYRDTHGIASLFRNLRIFGIMPAVSKRLDVQFDEIDFRLRGNEEWTLCCQGNGAGRGGLAA